LKGLILYVKKKIGKVPEGIMRSQIARPKNNDHNNKLSQSQASWGTSDFKPNMSHQKREKKEKGHKASITVILLGYY